VRSPLPADTARLAWRRPALVAVWLTLTPAVRAQVAGPRLAGPESAGREPAGPG